MARSPLVICCVGASAQRTRSGFAYQFCLLSAIQGWEKHQQTAWKINF